MSIFKLASKSNYYRVGKEKMLLMVIIKCKSQKGLSRKLKFKKKRKY